MDIPSTILKGDATKRILTHIHGNLEEKCYCISCLKASGALSHLYDDPAKARILDGFMRVHLRGLVSTAGDGGEDMYAASVPLCESCQKREMRGINAKPLMRCSRCKLSRYCSQECITKDWKVHKKFCRPAGSAVTYADIEGIIVCVRDIAIQAKKSDFKQDEAEQKREDDECATCKTQDKISFCTGCKKVKYCSSECQNRDWSAHKILCKKWKGAREKQENYRETISTHRPLHIPPEHLDNCGSCGKSRPKKMCACKETSYCSPVCQQVDWPTHKAVCKQSPYIDLRRFWPLIAFLVDASHLHSTKPLHIAFTKSILNSPRPGEARARFSDGWDANPVFLASLGPLDWAMAGFDPRWWPHEPDEKTRCKLALRIKREGFVLPILTAVTLALLAEMHGAAPDVDGITPRLCYETGPLSDFGVAAGSVRVVGQDKLGYVEIDTPIIRETHGQDPQDHYWLYFRTVRGEEFRLECNMFTFSMNMHVRVACDHYSYIPATFGHVPTHQAMNIPGWFEDREMRHAMWSGIRMHTERDKRSVLRNEKLQAVVERSSLGETPGELFQDPKDRQAVAEFMRILAGRKISKTEIDFAMTLAREHTLTLRDSFRRQEWKNYPEETTMGIDFDPKEALGTSDATQQAAWRKHRKERQLQKEMGYRRPKHT